MPNYKVLPPVDNDGEWIVLEEDSGRSFIGAAVIITRDCECCGEVDDEGKFHPYVYVTGSIAKVCNDPILKQPIIAIEPLRKLQT